MSVFRRTLCFGLSHHKRQRWRRRRLGKPRTKASLSRLEYESRTEEKTDGDEIVKLSGKAYPPFAISKALFCCFQNVNYLLGSAARGRSSCNNTERADNKAFMVQFLQWNGNFFFVVKLKGTRVEPDSMIAIRLEKLAFCTKD